MFKSLKPLLPGAAACGVVVDDVAGPSIGARGESTDSTLWGGTAQCRQFGHFAASPG
jgi:hypothetical protein